METYYRVLDEFVDAWYGNAGTDEINAAQSAGIGVDEIKRLSSEWGIPVEELMKQVEAI